MARDDSDWKAAAKAVPELRLLKMLVTGLSLVMGAGMIAVVALLWLRLRPQPLPELPPRITLPEGTDPQAITYAGGRIVVLTSDDRVLVLDPSGQVIGQAVISYPADR